MVLFKQNTLWLSCCLLLIAYLTFGWFLHDWRANPLSWALTILFSLVQASTLTILWKPTRDFILLGFKSDVGYFIMVLLLASLAVITLSWVHISTQLMMMTAAALLVRVDTLTLDMSNLSAMAIMTTTPLLGLGLSWLPLILFSPAG